MSKQNTALQELLDAARRHGERSDPEHEVGDLQDLLTACWKRLAPRDRLGVVKESWELLHNWR